MTKTGFNAQIEELASKNQDILKKVQSVHEGILQRIVNEESEIDVCLLNEDDVGYKVHTEKKLELRDIDWIVNAYLSADVMRMCDCTAVKMRTNDPQKIIDRVEKQNEELLRRVYEVWKRVNNIYKSLEGETRAYTLNHDDYGVLFSTECSNTVWNVLSTFNYYFFEYIFKQK